MESESTGHAREARCLRLLFAVPLLAVAFCTWCTAAQALIARGHVFGSSFASQGSGAGELSQPAGVAVNEATGDVYVVDRANNRIERFGAAGEFIAAWGWGVKDGAKEFEICESGCQAGIAGGGSGQMDSPETIAVDNSTNAADPSKGDVYVVSDARAEHGHIAKFSAAGEPLSAVKQTGSEPKWEGRLDGVAVDASGRLWVYRGVESESAIERFSDALKNKFEEPGLESSFACPKPGFAVDSAGENLYVDHERENGEELCPSEEGEQPLPVVTAKLKLGGEVLEPLFSGLDSLQTAAVATEASSGDVYVTNTGTAAAFSPSGSLIQRFALPGEHALGAGIAADAATGDVYVTDSAAGKVDVFKPEPPDKPTVTGLSAQNITPTSTKVSAQIDPRGADTHYFFQYGTVNCVSSPASCTDVPPPPGNDIGAGFADQSATVELQGLAPSTTYFYRVVATNKHGEAEGVETFGSITTLPTAEGVLPDGRAWEMVSPREKDGSGIEPLRNEGGLIQASADGNSITYVANGPIVPEPEGNRAPFPTQALATRSTSGWSSQQIVTPRVKGQGFVPGEAPEYRFFSSDLSLGLVQPDTESHEPLEQPPLSPEATEKTMYVRDTATGHYLPLVTTADDTAGSKFGEQLTFLGATPDLSHVVFASEVPLVAGAGAGLYESQPGPSLQPVSVLPDGTPAVEPALGAESHNVRGAVSSDGSRVFWTGDVENAETGETVRHLYMRNMATGKTLQLDAAVPPIVEPRAQESEVGFQAANSDGTKVFFTDTAGLTEASNLGPLSGSPTPNPADLYECEITEENGQPACRLTDLTVAASASESADILNVAPAVSEDGSFVYFVANGILAPGASAGHCVHSEQEVAPTGATCNLYVWHEGTISFIATLSNEDSGDWGSTQGASPRGLNVEPRPDLSDVTAGSSPNGQYLAFMSSRSLTGYNNVDTNPAAKGARDEEVYLYNASSKLIVCASCNPTGQPPHGVFDIRASGEGLGLVVDRRRDWAAGEEVAAPTDHWLAGSIPGWTPLGTGGAPEALRRPRYLSDSGRLFFNGADPLVGPEQSRTREEQVNGEATQVGVENVYEYDPNGVGTCARAEGCVALMSSGTSQQESAFVDASANGDNAFFVTAQPLVAGDRDTNFDLYDARVCTAESPCLTSEESSSRPCENSGTCRPTPAPAPASLGPSGTATFSGPPNQSVLASKAAQKPPPPKSKPLTRAQKLKAALKRCRRHFKHSKKRRAGCERQARRAYGAKGHARPKRGRK